MRVGGDANTIRWKWSKQPDFASAPGSCLFPHEVQIYGHTVEAATTEEQSLEFEQKTTFRKVGEKYGIVPYFRHFSGSLSCCKIEPNS